MKERGLFGILSTWIVAIVAIVALASLLAPVIQDFKAVLDVFGSLGSRA